MSNIAIIPFDNYAPSTTFDKLIENATNNDYKIMLRYQVNSDKLPSPISFILRQRHTVFFFKHIKNPLVIVIALTESQYSESKNLSAYWSAQINFNIKSYHIGNNHLYETIACYDGGIEYFDTELRVPKPWRAAGYSMQSQTYNCHNFECDNNTSIDCAEPLSLLAKFSKAEGFAESPKLTEITPDLTFHSNLEGFQEDFSKACQAVDWSVVSDNVNFYASLKRSYNG